MLIKVKRHRQLSFSHLLLSTPPLTPFIPLSFTRAYFVLPLHLLYSLQCFLPTFPSLPHLPAPHHLLMTSPGLLSTPVSPRPSLPPWRRFVHSVKSQSRVVGFIPALIATPRSIYLLFVHYVQPLISSLHLFTWKVCSRHLAHALKGLTL